MTPDEDHRRTVQILVTADEWWLIGEVLFRSLGVDERSPEGHLLFRCRGEDRIWSTGHGPHYQASAGATGPAPVGLAPGEEFAVSINSRFFLGRGPYEVTLRVEIGGDYPTQTMIGDGFEVTLPQPPQHPADWVLSPRTLPGIDVTVERIALERALMHVAETPLGVERSGRVAAFVQMRDRELRLEAPWGADYPATVASIPVAATAIEFHNIPRPHPLDGPTWKTAPILILAEQLAFLAYRSTDETVKLRLPFEPGSGLGLTCSELDAVFTPIDRFAGNRRRLNDILCDLLNRDDLEPDEDGDFVFDTREERCFWVRLATDVRPLAVQVFGTVGTRVPPTREVLEELNSINTAANYARAVWIDGTVHVVVDLLERDLDRSELDNAMQTVAATVDRYAPFLSSFFAESQEPPMLPGFE